MSEPTKTTLHELLDQANPISFEAALKTASLDELKEKYIGIGQTVLERLEFYASSHLSAAGLDKTDGERRISTKLADRYKDLAGKVTARIAELEEAAEVEAPAAEAETTKPELVRGFKLPVAAEAPVEIPVVTAPVAEKPIFGKAQPVVTAPVEPVVATETPKPIFGTAQPVVTAPVEPVPEYRGPRSYVPADSIIRPSVEARVPAAEANDKIPIEGIIFEAPETDLTDESEIPEFLRRDTSAENPFKADFAEVPKAPAEKPERKEFKPLLQRFKDNRAAKKAAAEQGNEAANPEPEKVEPVKTEQAKQQAAPKASRPGTIDSTKKENVMVPPMSFGKKLAISFGSGVALVLSFFAGAKTAPQTDVGQVVTLTGEAIAAGAGKLINNKAGENRIITPEEVKELEAAFRAAASDQRFQDMISKKLDVNQGRQ